MKKITAFALVLALCTVSVFAASSFSGKARIRLGIKQSWNKTDYKLTYGLADKATGDFKFFLLEDTKSKAGEGDVYGEVSAEGAVRIKNGTKKSASDIKFNNKFQALTVKTRFKFNYANLVFNKEKNFKLGIQGINPVKNYAKGWEIEADNGNLIGSDPFLTFETAFESDEVSNRVHGGWMPALTLMYDKYALSLALDAGYDGSGSSSSAVNGLAVFQANDIAVADGFKISADVGFFNSYLMKIGDEPIGQQMHILYGAKFDYNKDKLSLVAGVTGNVAVKKDNPFTDVDENNAVEASLNFAYNGDIKASVDAWFLDNQGLWGNGNEPSYVTYNNAADLGYVYRQADGKLLDPDELQSGNDVNNTIIHKALSIRAQIQPVKMLGITLRAQDILNQGILGIDLPISVTDSFTITPSFEYTLATNKTYNDGAWSLADGATANNIVEGNLAFGYTHKLFSLSANCRIGGESDWNADDEPTGIYFRPYLKATSKTLINGATLSLIWQKATLTTQPDTHKSISGKFHNGSSFGEIYLEARIDF